MDTTLLSYDQPPHGPSRTRRRPTRAHAQPTNGHQTNGHLRNRYLESPAEALDALAACTPADALIWFTHYLRRRDRVVDDIAGEEFASVLDTLAADFRTEAGAEPTSPHAAGLYLAAAVISDTATMIRVNERRDAP